MTKGIQTRQAIVEEALRLTSLVGLDALSIGQLAAAVGMSKSGLFAHFSSKEQLQLEVLRAASERFVARVLAPAVKEPRGVPRIRALFEGWLRWDRKEFPGGCVFAAAWAELDDQPGPVRDYFVDTQRDVLGTIATVARAGVEAKKLRDDLDPEQFAFEFFSILLSYQRINRLLPDLGAEKRARTALDALLERSVRGKGRS